MQADIGSATARRWVLRVLQALGVAWALPYTALGLVAGAASLAAGAHAHLSARGFAVVFHKVPWGPGGALTLGNVILHSGDSLESPCATYAHRAGHRVEPSIVIGDHERAHVYQYMVLGPLFLLGLVLCFEPIVFRQGAAETGGGYWMVYFGISALIVAGIREVLVITTPHEQSGFQNLLGDGARLRAAGVASLRLSPCAQGFSQVLADFDEVMNGQASMAGRAEAWAALGVPGPFSNGYLHRLPGMVWQSA